MSYGLLFRFADPKTAAEAVLRLKKSGLTHIEGYGPFPDEELIEALGDRRSRISMVPLIAALFGGLGAYLMQYYITVIEYPHDVGGRPLHSWPAFIPVTFELTVLSSALAIGVAFLVSTGLPRLHHPIFGIKDFERASDDRFFLCVKSSDPRFNSVIGQDSSLIKSIGADEVYDVPSV